MFSSNHRSVQFQEKMITARKRSLRQGNVFTHVCHSAHMGRRGLHPGGSASKGEVCIQGELGRPPFQDTWDSVLWDTVNKRAVRILLECFLVVIFYYKKKKRCKKEDLRTLIDNWYVIYTK